MSRVANVPVRKGAISFWLVVWKMLKSFMKQSGYFTGCLPFIKSQTRFKIRKKRKAFQHVFLSKWYRQLFYVDVYLLAYEKQKNLVLKNYYIFPLFWQHTTSSSLEDLEKSS